jgi:hypothetical protein
MMEDLKEMFRTSLTSPGYFHISPPTYPHISLDILLLIAGSPSTNA